MIRLFFILILFVSLLAFSQNTRSYGDMGNGTFLNPISAGDASDISPYTGNLLGNFRSLKLAIYNYGTGTSVFTNFHYLPLTRANN